MFDDNNKNESLYHAALLYTKKVKVGSPTKPDAEIRLRELLEEHGSFENIFKNSNGFIDLEQVIANTKGLKAVVRALEKVDFDFRVLTVNDDEYPQTLRDIEGTTPVLYVMGDTELFNEKGISVVGTRNLYRHNMVDAVLEGKDVVKRLVEKGYVIISGLAEGCDTLGHKHAIECRGRTIAVLGTPLDDYFPKFNRKLQEEIASKHLLVSQYPIGIRTFPSYFAHRNRTTVSLSSEGVVIVHSADKSGTQHAIRLCQEQEKPLYVLANNLKPGYDWVESAKAYLNFKLVRKNGNGADR